MAEDKTTAEFELKLREDMSGGAQNAAQALEKLRQQIQADSRELAEMQKAMRNLKSSTAIDVAKPMADLQKAIEGKRESIVRAEAAYVKFGGSFTKGAGRANSLKAVLGQLSQETARLPGPLGGIVQKLTSVVSGMSAAQFATAALTVGFIAMAAAAAVGVKSLFDEAVAAQDARRSELLHFEALTKVRNLWGIAPGKANEMQDAVDRVTASVSISRDKVSGYAATLYQSGLRGKNLALALEGTAIKASALGDAAGSGFAGWAVAMGRTGVSLQRLTDDVKARFGGVVQKQMSSLAVQLQKQKEGWASLFSGLDIDPFLEAMRRLRGLFSQNEASGRALKQLMTVLLQPLLGQATDGAVVLRRFFKQMIIGVQELVITFLIARNWFRETFGPTQHGLLGKLFERVQWGRVTVYLLAAAVGALTVGFLTLAGPALAFVALLASIGGSVEYIIESWDDLTLAFTQLDWGQLGLDIIKGIVGGLVPGGAVLVDALTEVAKSGYDAFKKAMGIASPSKVFMQLGLALPQGVAQGVEQGTPDVQAAVGGIVTPPNVPNAPDLGRNALGNSAQAPSRGENSPASPLIAPASAPVTLTINELHVHAESSEPKVLASAFRRELEAVFEGVSLQLGAQPMGGA
jgi:hypothetical protein